MFLPHEIFFEQQFELPQHFENCNHRGISVHNVKH